MKKLEKCQPKETKVPSKKKTHLYLNDRYLNKIDTIKNPSAVSVVYLYNNAIKQIENIDHADNLISLYLQKNQIEIIENLQNVKKLRKLYLGHNKISVVEGLENLQNLEELHVEKQQLPEGMSFCFDPRSLLTLSKTLQVLNIANNKMTSMSCLSVLRYLKVLNAAHNQFDDIEDICSTTRNLYYLTEATFTGNPICKNHRYRENIIANSYCLESLDGKIVTEETRCFIKRFEQVKMVRQSKQSVNIADTIPNLPRNYPPSLEKAISASMIRDARKKLVDNKYETFDERNAVHIAWNALPKHEAKLPSILKKQKKKNSNNIIQNVFTLRKTGL